MNSEFIWYHTIRKKLAQNREGCYEKIKNLSEDRFITKIIKLYIQHFITIDCWFWVLVFVVD